MKVIYYLIGASIFFIIGALFWQDAFWFQGGLGAYWRENWIEQPSFWIGSFLTLFGIFGLTASIYKMTKNG